MHSVNLAPLYGAFNEGLMTLLSGLAIWLAAYAKQWLSAHAKLLGEQTDAQLADGLNRALSNGVKIAMQRTEDLEKTYPTLPAKEAITAWAAQYAVDHSPAAMQRFGMSPQDLATKALAYLPTPQEQVAPPLTPPAPVTIQPLAPIKLPGE